MDESVQGQEPQGGESADLSPVEAHLQTVPEAIRGQVEPILKDWEKNVNARLAEAAELQKSLGPYKDVQGLSDYPPDQLSELLGWHRQVVSSPEAYQQWLAKEAEEAGFTKAEAEELQDAEESGELSPEKVQQIIDERLEKQLGPLKEQQTELESARQTDMIEQEIISELSRLEAENGEQFTDPVKQAILKFGEDHKGENWVQHGYEALKSLQADAQKAFVTDKARQPSTPMSTGGAEALAQPKTFDEAKEAMRERWRQMQS